MKKYSTFIFDSYQWQPETGTVKLNYSMDDEIRFTETLTLPEPVKTTPEMDVELDRALFALHLIGGISYYKTCLPKTIEIRSGTLSLKQAEFWNNVYENGLGEFFYKNDIDFAGLINFPSHSPSETQPTQDSSIESSSDEGGFMPEKKPRVLIPIGGGKDSMVTTELLREKADLTLFRMGHHPLIDQLAKTAGLPLLTINRALSPALFKLNEQGALNGHIPITAYLSCVTIFLSILYDFDAVAMSTEKSANFGNVSFKGKEINHQWSKSEEFERAFQSYVRDFITPRIDYKSHLRSMTELQIAEKFVQYPQYFPCTTSCNTNWKILGKKTSGAAMNPSPPASGSGAAMNPSPPGRTSGSWCCKCPKCAFVFALYAAFLPEKTLREIFGRNLLQDDWLVPLYRELLGLQGIKPFECVGTPEETKEAFRLAQKRGEMNDTVMMKMFTKDVLRSAQDDSYEDQ